MDNHTLVHAHCTVVTGAAQGIGRAVVHALAAAGTIVAALDCDQQGLAQLVAEQHELDRAVVAYSCDVCESAMVEQTIAQIEAEVAPINALVHVAGVLRIGVLDSYSNEDWATTFAVNTTGVFNVSRAVAQRMIPRKRGAIVTVASNAASTPRMGMGAYAASKAATTMLTKCLGLELAQHNIRCNIVAPGSTDTAMQRMLWHDKDGLHTTIAGTPETFRLGIPLGRIAAPEDIAAAVLFLLSDQARHITMHTLCVDGGATLGV